jgi:hypothetical protein
MHDLTEKGIERLAEIVAGHSDMNRIRSIAGL